MKKILMVLLILIVTGAVTLNASEEHPEMLNTRGVPVQARIIDRSFFVPINFFNDHPLIPVTVEWFAEPPQGVTVTRDSNRELVGMWELVSNSGMWLWFFEDYGDIQFFSDGSIEISENGDIIEQSIWSAEFYFTYTISGDTLIITDDAHDSNRRADIDI